jgi:hypothetical protein
MTKAIGGFGGFSLMTVGATNLTFLDFCEKRRYRVHDQRRNSSSFSTSNVIKL